MATKFGLAGEAIAFVLRKAAKTKLQAKHAVALLFGFSKQRQSPKK